MKAVSARWSQKRHGTATLMAIVLIGLVGATLAGMAVFSGNELKRAHRLADEARLRQLLLAGAADAVGRSHEWKDVAPAAEWSLALPDALRGDAAVKLQCGPAGDGGAEINVVAQYDNRISQQTLHFAFVNANWKLRSAELER
jgi:hypothetical protein